jgi:RecA/RadA recombinase
MAKKKEVLSEGTSLPSVFDLVKKVDDSVEIIAESAYSNIKEWIPTGSYILNACMSGDLFKGIPTGRITTFEGDSGVGKSFLACSICREAQKIGYTPIYMDSEGAIDSNFVSRLGVDPANLIIKQVSTIAETSQFIANVCAQLQEQEDKYGEHQKVIMVLDSLGNLTSDKERDDIMAGNNKRDMTKAQEIKALFRVNATPLARLQIPMIVNNHVYAAVGSYVPTSIGAGGSGIKYNSSLTIQLSAAKLDDKDNEAAAAQKQGADTTTKNGVLVTAKPVKSRFCRPYKVKFQIPYFCKPNQFVGLETFMNWENSGVVRGNLLTEKEFNKLSPADQSKLSQYAFEFNGNKLWANPKDTARGIVIKHLGCVVPITEFFTEKVFTQEFLEHLNKNIIHPMFDLPSQDSFEDIKEIENLIEVGTETPETEN